MVAQSSESKLHLQELVPPFELPSNGGEKVNLWDYKMRKNLVILFHHGGRCSLCRMRLRSFAEHYKDVSDRESEILAISSDDLETNRRLAIELDLPYPLLCRK